MYQHAAPGHPATGVCFRIESRSISTVADVHCDFEAETKVGPVGFAPLHGCISSCWIILLDRYVIKPARPVDDCLAVYRGSSASYSNAVTMPVSRHLYRQGRGGHYYQCMAAQIVPADVTYVSSPSYSAVNRGKSGQWTRQDAGWLTVTHTGCIDTICVVTGHRVSVN